MEVRHCASCFGSRVCDGAKSGVRSTTDAGESIPGDLREGASLRRQVVLPALVCVNRASRLRALVPPPCSESHVARSTERLYERPGPGTVACASTRQCQRVSHRMGVGTR